MRRFSAALVAFALMLPAAVAVPARADTRTSVPRPTGPYSVGRDTLHLVDHSRRDPWVPEAGARELMVGMFYPAVPRTGRPAPYATLAESRLFLQAYGLADVFPAETLSATTSSGREGAEPVRGRYPLVVLSPGFVVGRYTLTGLAEELASRGYVVAAVDHAYESAGTTFPDGRVLTCVACEKAQTEQDMEVATAGRGEDVSFVLDRLTGTRPAWRHARLIDRGRIGMAGFSLGGASAASTMARDPRVRAGINMDGAFHAAVPPGGLGGRPFMMFGTDDETHRPGGKDRSWDQAWPRLNGWKRWLTVAGAAHSSFTDIPVFLDQLAIPTPEPITGARSLSLTRTYVTAFFDRHLRNLPRPILDTPTTPEVIINNP